LGWGGAALRCNPAKVSRRHYFDALNNAEKNQKQNKIADKITVCTPLYHAKTLVADAIILLSGDKPDKYLFRLSKNKEGEIGDLPITFNKQIQRFQEYTWMD
jgi:replicative DNA helicase